MDDSETALDLFTLQVLVFPVYFVQSAEWAVGLCQLIVNFFINHGIHGNDTSQVAELMNCFQFCPTNGDVRIVYFLWCGLTENSSLFRVLLQQYYFVILGCALQWFSCYIHSIAATCTVKYIIWGEQRAAGGISSKGNTTTLKFETSPAIVSSVLRPHFPGNKISFAHLPLTSTIDEKQIRTA